MKSRVLVVVLSLVGLVIIALVMRATRPTDDARLDAGDAQAEASEATTDAQPDALTDAMDSGSAPVADAAPDASLTACAMLAAENDMKLAAVDGSADCVKAPQIDCSSASGVAWGARISSLVVKDENTVKKGSADWDVNKCASKVELELVRIDADGGVAAMRPTTLLYTWDTDENRISLAVLSDYDGDGEPELLRTTDVRMHEGTPRHGSQVMAYKNKALAPYAKAPTDLVWRAADVDDDGRVDLITSGPYEKVVMKNVFGADLRVAPRVFVQHSIKDGSFSATDDAAKAFTKLACPSKPTLDFAAATDGSKSDDVALLVVCARVWGASEQEIVVAWKNSCSAEAGGGNPLACQPWPKQLASIAPPFVLK